MGTRLAHISHYPKQMFSSVFLEILCPAIGFVTFHTKWNLPHRMETSSGDTTTEERRSKDKKNYRSVSCLAAASKALEKIVCDQITRFMETNKLLPDSQHGF